MVCHCEESRWRDDEAIQLDRDDCEAPAATARCAHLLMNTEFVILNEVKNPCSRQHARVDSSLRSE
jgi:hypothetical protein